MESEEELAVLEFIGTLQLSIRVAGGVCDQIEQDRLGEGGALVDTCLFEDRVCTGILACAKLGLNLQGQLVNPSGGELAVLDARLVKGVDIPERA